VGARAWRVCQGAGACGRAARRAGEAKANPFADDDEGDRYRDGLDPSYALAKKVKRDSIVGATERRGSQRR